MPEPQAGDPGYPAGSERMRIVVVVLLLAGFLGWLFALGIKA